MESLRQQRRQTMDNHFLEKSLEPLAHVSKNVSLLEAKLLFSIGKKKLLKRVHEI